MEHEGRIVIETGMAPLPGNEAAEEWEMRLTRMQRGLHPRMELSMAHKGNRMSQRGHSNEMWVIKTEVRVIPQPRGRTFRRVAPGAAGSLGQPAYAGGRCRPVN